MNALRYRLVNLCSCVPCPRQLKEAFKGMLTDKNVVARVIGGNDKVRQYYRGILSQQPVQARFAYPGFISWGVLASSVIYLILCALCDKRTK